MFHTYPEAELPVPPALASFGERSWHWVECALQIPYFFLSVGLETDEGSFRRHFLFSHLKDLLSLVGASGDHVKEIEIGLLSPGYMNGSNSYQLGKIKEIWECRDTQGCLFIMSDGAKYHYPSDIGCEEEQAKELILSL